MILEAKEMDVWMAFQCHLILLGRGDGQVKRQLDFPIIILKPLSKCIATEIRMKSYIGP